MTNLTRILVATDLSEAAGIALEQALMLAKPFRASVVVLHVVEDSVEARLWSSEIFQALSAEAQTEFIEQAQPGLKQYLDAFDTGEVAVMPEIRVGRPAPTIVGAARDYNADLIVVGTHGRTGLAHLLIGSVAEHVLRTADCPVMAVRVTQASRARELAHRPWVTSLAS
jgi:nucleotide-binding universal stress UspA family protein